MQKKSTLAAQQATTNTRFPNLRRRCLDLGLCPKLIDEVEQIAAHLCKFETHGRRRVKSIRARSKELDALRQSMQEICQSIAQMDIDSSGSLSDRLFRREKIFDESGHQYVEARWDYELVERLQRVMKEIDHVRESIGQGKSGGRAQTLPHHAGHVLSLALTVCTESDIPFGRNNEFEELCEAVFEAAGIQTSPEAAIKLCIKNFSTLVRGFINQKRI